MNRRNFLKSSMAMLASCAVSPSLFAAPTPESSPRTLVNVFLEGGPDFRQFFAPDPQTQYGAAYFRARSSLFGLDSSSTAAHQEYFSQNYEIVELSNQRFGVWREAGWLIGKIRSGEVALVQNVAASPTRDHNHSSLVWNSGDLDTGPHDASRSGWGGRIAQLTGKKILSCTQEVRLFCNGEHPTNPLDHDNSAVIAMPNMENFGFTQSPWWNPAWIDRSQGVSRAVEQYYRSKRAAISNSSPYARFMQTERNMRELGAQIKNRLENEINPQGGFTQYREGQWPSGDVRRPTAFDNLFSDPEGRAHEPWFVRQVLNLYYSYLCRDILDFNVASLELGGWDSHDRQNEGDGAIHHNFHDLFGSGMTLDVLEQGLKLDSVGSYENTVFLVGGEFGRQLRSNGDRGTDHGRGNLVLVIGEGVSGGVYGTMFPEEEIPLYEEWGSDIEGQTSMLQIFGRVAEWLDSGLAEQVLPNYGSQAIESGIDLSFLS